MRTQLQFAAKESEHVKAQLADKEQELKSQQELLCGTRDELQKVRFEYEQFKLTGNGFRSKADELCQQLSQRAEVENELRSKVTNLRGENEKLVAELLSKQRQFDNHQIALNSKDDAIRQIQSQVSSLRSQLDSAAREKERLESESLKMARKHSDGKLQQVLGQLSEKTRENNELRSRLDIISEVNQKMSENNKFLQERSQGNEASSVSLREQLTRVSRENEQAREQLRALQLERDGLKRDNENSAVNCRESKNQLEQAIKDLYTRNMMVNELQDRINVLQELNKRFTQKITILSETIIEKETLIMMHAKTIEGMRGEFEKMRANIERIEREKNEDRGRLLRLDYLVAQNEALNQKIN